MSDNTQELINILNKLKHLVKPYMVSGVEEDWQEYQAEIDKLYIFIKTQTNQAVLEALDRVEKEVIGAIEPSYDTENPWEADKRHGANILRAEQRKKLATLRKELTQEVQTDE